MRWMTLYLSPNTRCLDNSEKQNGVWFRDLVFSLPKFPYTSNFESDGLLQGGWCHRISISGNFSLNWNTPRWCSSPNLKARRQTDDLSSETVSIERTFPFKMEYITKMSKQSQDNIQVLLKVFILATIAGAAISSRLFSVIRYLYLSLISNL